jgi:hypothetical protein
VDEAPTGRDGHCHGIIVANIAQGSLDGTDLSGTKVALGYFSPGKISDGHLRLGLVIDEAAPTWPPRSSAPTRVSGSCSSTRVGS